MPLIYCSAITCCISRVVLDLPPKRVVIKKMLGRFWLAALLWMLPVTALAIATPSPRPRSATLALRESRISKTLARASQFVDVPHVTLQPACEDIRPPEPLTTPDPLFAPAVQGRRVKVSFIIGIDGRVHAPLILESAGFSGDRHVLQTVRTWRYRPATCNGVPTETEGKIEFSSR
jgi:TonB family protein